MDMYDAKQLYDRLKVSERDDETLDLDARLRAMNGPLLAWYEEHARILPWRENPEGYRVWKMCIRDRYICSIFSGLRFSPLKKSLISVMSNALCFVLATSTSLFSLSKKSSFSTVTSFQLKVYESLHNKPLYNIQRQISTIIFIILCFYSLFFLV